MMIDEDLTFAIQLANEAEQFDDAIILLRQLIVKQQQLDSLQRELFLSCSKAIINKFRLQYRTAESYLSQNIPDNFKDIVRQEIHKITSQIQLFNRTINEALDMILIPNSHNESSRIFFLKMKADYQRYLTEISMTEQNMTLCQIYYEECIKNFQTIGLLPKIEVLLNYSVFHYEIIGDVQKAISTSTEALQLASQSPFDVNEEIQELLSLIQDNLQAWKNEIEGHQTAVEKY